MNDKGMWILNVTCSNQKSKAYIRLLLCLNYIASKQLIASLRVHIVAKNCYITVSKQCKERSNGGH